VVGHYAKAAYDTHIEEATHTADNVLGFKVQFARDGVVRLWHQGQPALRRHDDRAINGINRLQWSV
jgi:hypothetical protein